MNNAVGGDLRSPRIVLLSPYDPRDPKRASGTINAIFVALQRRGANIRFVSGGSLDRLGRAAGKVMRLFGVEADVRFSKPFAWLAGLWCSARLRALRPDAIVAVLASNYVAYLWAPKPIIYISDTTFAAIGRLYPEFKSFPAWLRQHGDDLERRSLRRAAHVIYPSAWARQSAIEDYLVDDRIISVLPFGPNIDDNLLDKCNYEKQIDFNETIRILYVAANWKRKRGDLVIEIGRALRRAGCPCHIYLVGQIPSTIKAENWVHIVGVLDKTNEASLTSLCALYENAHFFLMPTIADASPIVFSEAQAFGCPSVTYDVGGTATAVLDRETGIVLPLTARAEDFAWRIAELARDPAAYQKMSWNARRRYEQFANWGAWAETILRLAATLTERSLPLANSQGSGGIENQDRGPQVGVNAPPR